MFFYLICFKVIFNLFPILSFLPLGIIWKSVKIRIFFLELHFSVPSSVLLQPLITLPRPLFCSQVLFPSCLQSLHTQCVWPAPGVQLLTLDTQTAAVVAACCHHTWLSTVASPTENLKRVVQTFNLPCSDLGSPNRAHGTQLERTARPQSTLRRDQWLVDCHQEAGPTRWLAQVPCSPLSAAWELLGVMPSLADLGKKKQTS
jgi:hypothetical protein